MPVDAHMREGRGVAPLEALRDEMSPGAKLLARNWHVVRRRIRDEQDDPLASGDEVAKVEAPTEIVDAAERPFELRPARALVSMAIAGSSVVLVGLGWSLARLLAAS
ncbi:MAG: hypothetical protein D6705_18145 [Deltaproteobacteria bacterium]|nr:MAG: hypothetical protein D6705_18145 [Deltaproteobacteria bacterium]